MANPKLDKVAVRTVFRLLDGAAKKNGLMLVKSAATKWCNAQRDRARLTKQKASLERELEQLQKRLGVRG